MDKIVLKANGKLNLSLDITGLREDGYHLMDMIMQSVSLSDEITAERESKLSAESFPFGEKDIAYKAALAYFSETGINGGVKVSVKKYIPDQAGMAGGSADAAAVLLALDRLYGTNLSSDERIRIGVKAGADVPFCMIGGTARVSGIGEKVKSLPFFSDGSYLIIKPDFGVSTPAAFKAFDSLNKEDLCRPNNEKLIKALQEKKFSVIQQLSGNVLETAANLPEISRIRLVVKNAGAKLSLMTGSGSAVFGWFSEKDTAEKVSSAFLPYGKVYTAFPRKSGIEIIEEK